MTRNQTEELAQFLSSDKGQDYHDFWDTRGPDYFNAPDIGFITANSLARTRVRPDFLRSSECRFILSAVSLLTGSPATSPTDKATARALELHGDDQTASLIEALLLAENSSEPGYEPTHELVGESPEAIAAFAELFFNLPDRMDELAYLQHVVEHSRHSDLLRVAFNGTPFDVLQYLGFSGCMGSDTATELVNRIRLNALSEATAYLAGGSSQPPSQLASLGLGLALKTEVEIQPENTTSRLSDAIRADLMRASDKMRAAITAEALASLTTGSQPAAPEPKEPENQ